jgi:hypothetical protein
MKMEGADFSRILVPINQVAQHHNSEDVFFTICWVKNVSTYTEAQQCKMLAGALHGKNILQYFCLL